jgi:molybdopterin-guanine dinucleotide biosynthesis protein
MSQKTPFKYRAFGLNIHSDFEIAEMYPAHFDRQDVTVVMAETPDAIENPSRQGVRFQLTDTEFLLNVDDVARYYVTDGSAISVEKRNGSSMQEVRLFLLGVVFGALLHQRGLVPFHGSTLKGEGGTSFMVCGRSGIGKSTLTAHLVQNGYALLSDDVSVVRPEEGKVMVQPSFPFIKLWKDVMEHVDFSLEEGNRLREPLEKYGYRMDQAFHSEPVPVRHVFVLNVHNQEEYKTEELKGIDKFNALKNQTFRFQFVTDKNRPRHFTVLNQMAQSVKVFRITRPQAPMDIERLFTKINSTIQNRP